MGTYLEDHPPKVRQFRRPRRERPSGVGVVHTAESAPDEVGPDDGAENVARFIETRDTYGSYHDIADSDSEMRLVPYDAEAYGDGTGSNPHAYHVSAATQAHRWASLPPEWREATVKNMARSAARYHDWLLKTEGIKIPAKRITRAQSEARVPGWISHAERDPERRGDPGAGFMWVLFLTTFRDLTDPPKVPNKIKRAIEEMQIEVERVKAAREYAKSRGENPDPYTRVLKALWLAQRRARNIKR